MNRRFPLAEAMSRSSLRTASGGPASRRIVGVLAALMVSSAALTLAAPAASAQPIGTVIIVPGESIDIAAIRLRTSRGCPATANSFLARMWGQGMPPEGLVVTRTTAAGMSFSSGFDVYLAQTMRDFADLNAIPVLAGRYDIVVSCIDKFPSRVKGEFTGALEFTSPTTYRAIGDSMPVGPPPEPLVVGGDGLAAEQGLNPLDAGSAAIPPPVPDAGDPGAGASLAPAPGVVPPPGADAAAGQPTQVPDAVQAAPRTSSSGASYLPLVLIGLLVVVPGVVAVVHGLRRRRSP